MPEAALYKVAYNEAVRALSEQQAAIESVRARAGLLLSASAVTTSFLGAQALQGGGSRLFSWLALVAFLAVAAASLAILWPRGWEFTASPGRLESCIESGVEVRIEVLYRALSSRMQVSFSDNHEGLVELAGLFQVASGLLTIEVVLWVAAIALGH